MKILGIESSCDETAAAVVVDGEHILSSVVASQINIHSPYGGVVPELASRKHIEAMVPVVEEAVLKSGLQKEELDAVAVTQGPGLVGALLVGFSFAKSFAYALQKPWVGVNHLEAHLNSVFLEPDPPPFPFISLLVSGGHTAIYDVQSHTRAVLMGQTRDDAAGEAFDKVAKMLDLGYPGGVIIDKLSQKGNPEKIRFPRAYLDKDSYDFSFSGIKTSVNRYIQLHADQYQNQTADIAAAFQEAVVEVLCFKLIHAAERKGYNHITIVGGAAANSRLRQKVYQEAAKNQLSVHIPSLSLCGDNAAMVAAAGYHRLLKGETGSMDADVYSRTVIPVH
jgi:N6-L-threonylcarbamoyladenine synthase